MKAAIVDYGAGNVVSVQRAFQHVGAVATLTAIPAEILAADVVVFPGQGHFGQAIARLRATKLDQVLADVIAADRPFFGICLGLQLLFEASDEAPGVAGLGVFRGRCVRFEGDVKVPQIGWNAVKTLRPGTALGPPSTDQGQPPHYYFVHSYHAICQQEDALLATAEHGQTFTAAVSRGRLLATQFHPEKSGNAGLSLIGDFLQRAASC